MQEVETADFLVVGGGAAGAIVSRRLAELTRGRIILIEAGPSDENDDAANFLSRLDEQTANCDWGYRARPHRHTQSLIEYARAKLLGGCANHNDCAFLTPPDSDFAEWAALGAAGWGPDDVKPYFQKVRERIFVESAPPVSPVSRAFVEAGLQAGLDHVNFNAKIVPGVGCFPLNSRGDRRQSSSVAYLHPLDQLPKHLEVWTNVTAFRLIMEGRRVTGVETERGPIMARREVLLTCGAINSPKLMMVSGIGPAEDIRPLGISVIANLPGVGRNLMDHIAANIALETLEPVAPWELTPCEVTMLIRVDGDASAPDVLFHFVLRLREKYAGKHMFADVPHGVKISPNVARPKSRGTVGLASPDPREPPLIDLNYLSDPEGYDRRILLAGLRWARKVAGQPALSRLIANEVAPGAEVTGDDELLAYVLDTCETVYHPSGTCRIGAPDEPLSVVTPDLKVRGVECLRVVDASVFPAMVTVNICNTVMMVAERAAEICAGSAG